MYGKRKPAIDIPFGRRKIACDTCWLLPRIRSLAIDVAVLTQALDISAIRMFIERGASGAAAAGRLVRFRSNLLVAGLMEELITDLV